MKTRKSYYTSLALVLGIIVVVNLLSADYFARLDLTESKSYTLSKATKDILKELPEAVTVKAYFSENLPPAIERTRQDFKDLLVEYATTLGRNVVYEFINPNESDERKQEAQRVGISPIMINVREKDQMKQQEAYMGAVVEMGENQEVIPFMQPGEAMEYTLTTSIKKISVKEKPYVALIQGHKEATKQGMSQVSEALSVLYRLEEYTLNDSTSIPDRFKTIAIVAPEESISEQQLDKLDDFLRRGGNILLAYNRVEGNLQSLEGTALTTGIEDWLAKKGVIVENKFLLDVNCASVTVQRQQGFFRLASEVSFPYIPILREFADHPITRGLEAVSFPFISPITFQGDTSKVRMTPLMFSSERSAAVAVPTSLNIQKQWEESDFPLKQQIAAMVLEGALVGDKSARLVVIGDGDFAVNAKGEGQPQPVQPDNLSLLVNSIDWLSDDTGLIDLRTKGITSRPLDDLEEGTRNLLKYGNFLVPMLFVLLYGIVRAQRRKSLRIKRMEERYE